MKICLTTKPTPNPQDVIIEDDDSDVEIIEEDILE